jgi:arylsulfatase A-like enzyme
MFVWAHYFDPHDTLVIPEDPSVFEKFPPRDSSPKARYLAAYDAEIRYMDEQVGHLVDRMRMLDRPLVVAIVGDHGEGLDDHGWWGHSILYQEQIRVPMILVGPGIPAGGRVDSIVRTVDLAPTILKILGLDPGEHLPGIDGVDLGPLAREESADLGLEAYAEQITAGMLNEVPYQKGKYDTQRDLLFCLIEGEWKYIHHYRYTEESELYNLAQDPDESENLLDSRPELVAGFRERLDALRVFQFDRAAGEGMSEADRQRLRSLGYLQETDEPGSGGEASDEEK